jgi:hypothetical protein
MRRGIACNLFISVRGISQLYKGSLDLGIHFLWLGNSIAGSANGPPTRKTLWESLAVELELRSSEKVDCQVVPGRYILHTIGPCTKVAKWKALIGCLSWHRLLCGEDTNTISIWMMCINCTIYAECKSIRIAVYAVMDGWNGHFLAQCWFYFWNVFGKERKLDGVLVEYCRKVKMRRRSTRGIARMLRLVMWRWPGFQKEKGLPPSTSFATKLVLKMFFNKYIEMLYRPQKQRFQRKQAIE